MKNSEADKLVSSEEYKKVTEELYKQNLEVVRLYKEVEKLNEDLKTANEGQANLLHIINHQIKGYLSKSRNIFSELLTEPGYNACTDEAKPLLSEGFNSMTEGVTFVQNFLNASNIDRGMFTYNMVPADFKKIVTDIAETQKSAIQEKGLAFELNVAEGDYGITGDIIQLGQAVRNLLDNAMHYTLQGSVWAKLERVGDKVVFSVKDTGVGLSDEVKPKLFTKGGRDKDSQKININSTGFGLAFVKGVAEAHKGRVWAESEGPGKGSTFYLELPVK
ncbi:MAG: HAMP domain-containing sensor histidine kinase [Patescibacteria group bacterium]